MNCESLVGLEAVEPSSSSAPRRFPLESIKFNAMGALLGFPKNVTT